MTTTFTKAQKGDLCVVCRLTVIHYQDKPPEERRRWLICRVAIASRDGRVKAVKHKGQTYALIATYFDLSQPVYVASKDIVDVEAALKEAWQHRGNGFTTFEEAREFLKRFKR